MKFFFANFFTIYSTKAYNECGEFMSDIENKIIETLNELRPYLNSDGGDVEFIKYENGTVYIKMLGACADCEYIDYTIKDSIEEVLVNLIPEVKQVIQVSEH